MWSYLRLWFKRLFMALVAALATVGLLVWLALRFWALPLIEEPAGPVREKRASVVEKAAPAEPVIENRAPVEVSTVVQRPADCQPDKRFCKDMTTCEEARFYLTTCGLSGLDRNKDGVPCEKLCR
jgi:hypothetical protein